jgi:AcrR family transcriptional regulator
MTQKTRKPPQDSARNYGEQQLPAVRVIEDSAKRTEVSSVLPSSEDNSLAISALVTHLGTIAARLGVRHLESPTRVAVDRGLTIEQFRALSGDAIAAIAMPYVEDAEQPVWRAQIFRYPQEATPDASCLIAEVTQRFQLVARQVVADTESVPDADAGSSNADQIQEPKEENSVSTKRQDAVDRRRMQIFRGACEVISKKGWANASIRDIVQAAKIPIPTMYQYIKGKEDILYLVTSMCMEEILQYFQERVDEDKEPLESLEDAIAAYFQYINKNRRYINLVYSETRSLSDENREKIFYLERKFIHLWEAVLVKGNQAGVFNVANTDLAANLIYFLCTSWSLRHWSIGRYAEEEVRQQILNIVMNGIAKQS